MSELAAASFVELVNSPMMIVARMPRMMTTIRISTSVKARRVLRAG